MSEKDSKKCRTNSEENSEHLSYLLPDPLQRGFASVVMRMASDDDFRCKFWADPAAALNTANLKVDPRVIDVLIKSEREVIDRVIDQAHEVMVRAPALDLAGKTGTHAVTLLAALAVGLALGALVTEVAHHHFTLASDLPTSKPGA